MSPGYARSKANLMHSLGKSIDRWVIHLGDWVLLQVKHLGRFLLFFMELVRHIPLIFRNPHITLEQMYLMGITSLPLVCLTSVFTGAVAAWQAAYQFADYVPLRYIGTAVEKSVILELGPVLTALVVAGRVGAAITAEIGTMAVTEQLDAMRCLNLNPYRYLLAPRLFAGLVMLPVLTIFACLVAIMGAFFVVVVAKDLPPTAYSAGLRLFYSDMDIVVGMIKSIVFGIVIASYGCYYGFFCSNGAEGVGQSTRASVVASNVSILISGFLISNVLLN